MTGQQYPTREQIAARLTGDIFDAVPDDNDMQHVLTLAAAILSQPTPSAEPERTYTAADVQEAFERGCIRGEQDANERNWSRRQYEEMQDSLPPAAPPSIADMAPGTTQAHEFEPGRYSADGIRLCRARALDGDGIPAPCHRPADDRMHLDPSTIRDVTEPATPEAN